MLIRTLGVAVAAACKFIRTIVASTAVKHDLQNRKDENNLFDLGVTFDIYHLGGLD